MLVGADPDELDRAATQMQRFAERLSDYPGDVQRAIRTSAWVGRDAQHFEQEWGRQGRAAIDRAAQLLVSASETLRRNAEDQRRASAADTAVGGGPTDGPAGGDGGARTAPVIPAGIATAAPATVAAWWNGLTEAEQQALVEQRPDLVGNLDGIPPADRYAANHQLIEGDLAELRAQQPPDSERIRLLENLLDDQVILYQPDLGRLATVQGDIGNADHVAVVVPGTTSNFDGFLSQTQGKGNAVYNAANRYAPGEVAVVSWLGYDAPPTIPQAAFPGRAEEGAQLLSGFTNGLGLDGDQHLTLIGHSYGSTVVGMSVLAGSGADDLVVAGSPGIGVDRESELDLPGHVYAEKAPGDIVTHLESFGEDPAMPSFGGVRLTTNADGLPPVEGHSSYFDPSSAALSNMGRVVAGEQPITQSPSVADHVGDGFGEYVLDNPVVDPVGVGLEWVSDHYDGPGSGVVDGAARAGQVVDGLVETGVRNVVDTGGDLIDEAGDVIGGLLD